MIRILVASHSDELENAIRSAPSLEFAGRVGQDFSGNGELLGDILLYEVGHAEDWHGHLHSLGDLPIPVILLLGPAEAHIAVPALRSGIRGAIAQDATPEEIEAAVQAVNAGLVVTAEDFVSESPVTAEDLLEPLSDREREVLELVAEGLSNKLIAHHLNISEHTVKTHIASIFAKLGASSRTEAVSQAIRKGLVML